MDLSPRSSTVGSNLAFGDSSIRGRLRSWIEEFVDNGLDLQKKFEFNVAGPVEMVVGVVGSRNMGPDSDIEIGSDVGLVHLVDRAHGYSKCGRQCQRIFGIGGRNLRRGERAKEGESGEDSLEAHFVGEDALESSVLKRFSIFCKKKVGLMGGVVVGGL